MEGTGSSGGHGVVLKNVDVALSEADVVRLLQEQNLSALSASRFHRTARGKPAKALPLMRVMVSDEAQQMALLSSGAHIMGTHCPAGPVHNKADSASARGWTPDGPQHRPNRQPPKPEPPPAPTTAVEAVAPLQMVPYAEQLAQKRASVLEALEPLSSASFQVDSVLPSPRTEGYRNKCEFSIGTDASGQPCVGFVVGRQSGAHTIESPASVSLVSSEMRAAVVRVEAAVRRSSLPAYDRGASSGFWLQLSCRQSFNSGSPPQLLLVLTVKTQGYSKAVVDEAVNLVSCELQSAPLDPAVRLSLMLQRDENSVASAASGDCELLWGAAEIEEVLCGLRFRISPASFFQVNTSGAESLITLLRSQCALTPDSVLLDVCCGTGTIGLCMAASAKRVLGIEACAAAVEDARRNAQHNGIANATFVAAKAEAGLKRILADLTDKERANLIAVVDPPRAGLHPSVLHALRACKELTRLLFVSCHVPGFVSNASILCQPSSHDGCAPFALARAFPIDLFPDTRHCELVVLLERAERGIPNPRDDGEQPASKRARSE